MKQERHERFALLVAALASQVAALAQTPASPPSLEEQVKALQEQLGQLSPPATTHGF
jgi:hypothetical protein